MNANVGMPAQRRVGVVLVGGGIIAAVHAEHYLSPPACELVAIVDPFPSGQELADRLSVMHFTSVTALLAESETQPDLYVVCAPSALHMQVATEVLTIANPKAIMVEKPFCTDSASGALLLELAASKGCKVAVGHHRRFHPAVTVAKELTEDGALGDITAISGVWTCKENDGYFDLAKWRQSRKSGGGPIWINLVHDIDLLHYLTGSKIIRVWATATIPRRINHSEEQDAVEEGAAIMLQFENSIVGTFLVNDNVASPFGWESATGDPKIYAKASLPVDCYRLFGTKGTLSIPDGSYWTYPSKESIVYRDAEIGWHVQMDHKIVTEHDKDVFQQQAEHLVQLASGVGEPRCPGTDGLAAVKVCEALVEALDQRNGHPVEVR